MYKTMALISLIIRTFCLPNPFEALENGVSIPLGGDAITLPPAVANWAAEPFMYVFTYMTVHFYYERGNSAWGSFLYLFFYAVHTFLLWLMALLEFRWWGVGGIFMLYIACHVAVNRIKERFIWQGGY